MRDSSQETVIRSLQDAGCDKDTIEKFIDCIRKGNRENQLRLLSEQRSLLLDRVHEEERKIDCLDYLIYRLSQRHIVL